MKLTKEQADEIKNQQSQSNPTKRVTAPELEKILYEGNTSFRPRFCKSN
jgi:thymidylate synthase (FAD)